MPWQTFGFEKQKQLFERLIESGQLAHAYLFTGPEMIGKQTFARDLANMLASQADVFVLDTLKDNTDSLGIDEIRRLKQFMSLSPYASARKVALINDAHLMTVEAQNALLKVLEEPSSSSQLILVTDQPGCLLETISSRCQAIEFTTHPDIIVNSILTKQTLTQIQQTFLLTLVKGRTGLLKTLLEKQGLIKLKQILEQLAWLSTADLNQRFQWVQTSSVDDRQLKHALLLWLLYAHCQKPLHKHKRLLRNLLNTYSMVQRPGQNTRLVLEQFILRI